MIDIYVRTILDGTTASMDGLHTVVVVCCLSGTQHFRQRESNGNMIWTHPSR